MVSRVVECVNAPALVMRCTTVKEPIGLVDQIAVGLSLFVLVLVLAIAIVRIVVDIADLREVRREKAAAREQELIHG